MRATVAVLAMLVGVSAAPAQVYKWTDAGGTAHYSAIPPPAGSYKTIHAAGSAQDLNTPAPAHAATTAAAKPGDAMVDSPANRTKLCTDLQHNLGLLQGKDPLTYSNGKDAPQPMDDKRRQQELTQAQSQYAQYCGQ